jgi:hypothetical protein
MIRLVLEFDATTILPNASQGYIGATVFFVVNIARRSHPVATRLASGTHPKCLILLQAGAVAKKQKPAVVDPTCLESFDKKNMQVISRHPRGQWIRPAVRARNGHPIGEERSSFRRKDDARELLMTGDIVCGRRTTADLDVVIVPLQQSWLIEV